MNMLICTVDFNTQGETLFQYGGGKTIVPV